MPAEVWSTAFTPEDGRGNPVPPHELPLMITLAKKRPAYRRFFIRGLVAMDGWRTRRDETESKIRGRRHRGRHRLGAVEPVD
jgi:hypothetical protein